MKTIPSFLLLILITYSFFAWDKFIRLIPLSAPQLEVGEEPLCYYPLHNSLAEVEGRCDKLIFHQKSHFTGESLILNGDSPSNLHLSVAHSAKFVTSKTPFTLGFRVKENDEYKQAQFSNHYRQILLLSAFDIRDSAISISREIESRVICMEVNWQSRNLWKCQEKASLLPKEGQWFTLTVDPKEGWVKLYLDGELAFEENEKFSLRPFIRLRLGASIKSIIGLKGNYSDLRIFSTALTEEQVKALFLSDQTTQSSEKTKALWIKLAYYSICVLALVAWSRWLPLFSIKRKREYWESIFFPTRTRLLQTAKELGVPHSGISTEQIAYNILSKNQLPIPSEPELTYKLALAQRPNTNSNFVKGLK
ncbi:MAG: hypothetical protein A2508_10670 [Candidatus Lambdaproteobacteria bacterium RIFOXYD12_FULL_49_8]|uniref:Uncharacterized protein n=1 Tax=Candidatus Lambdaproteobacteria bacterium RIFOXYD2_FULL_50_16 TaxID=1817772 RepID=A0A1F6G4U2_9PROT|nr:MAG: hypothetical protein A2527_14455 [Candidatus Lambdaproteobacteria bacterium RIFOXYD2_FULL_50_16]OGG98344.1 MAG: hypothetical protein A2508_10670 [Candidatus Lambdaproteobacteria bacterium RIFOXYD12_FULL_49_8]